MPGQGKWEKLKAEKAIRKRTEQQTSQDPSNKSKLPKLTPIRVTEKNIYLQSPKIASHPRKNSVESKKNHQN